MENKKIDITSTVLEKGIDVAKNFLDKLIMPSVEEAGLLLRDSVTMWKFKKQVRMLNQAKIYCERNNISPKTISLKLLCPLLDYSGIEEDEILEDKWAILLSNLVDSEQNIQNHVFPYILSQLSNNEFVVLEKAYIEKIERVKRLTIELEDFKKNKPTLEKELKEKILRIDEQVDDERKTSRGPYNDYIRKLLAERANSQTQLSSLQSKELGIKHLIWKPAILTYTGLEEYELSNVIRLGLIKEEKEFNARTQTLEIPSNEESPSDSIYVDLNIDIESDKDDILTELGELFINACMEKKAR